MRVLHFAHSYVPQFGGTTTRLLNLLADPGHEHLLVVHKPSAKALPKDVGEVPRRERLGHVDVRRVDIRNLGFAGRVPLLNVHRQTAALLAAVAGESVELVHGHNPTSSALASCAAAKRLDVPLVYEAHGIMHYYSNLPKPFGPIEVLNGLAHSVMRSIVHRYERHILNGAERIIVQTQASGEHLRRLYGLENTPFDIISNGVDTERFDPSRWVEAREAWRAENGWRDSIVCLYAGYLDHVNGISQLLDVVAQLDAEVRGKLRFVFAGRGPAAELVRRAAESSEAVTFLGLVDYERMPGLVAASDVFLIPRPPVLPAETFRPMKLMEAMAMEKVLLVSDVAAMAELIRHEENGLLYEKGDAAALRAALVGIAERFDQYASLGAQARRDVVANHTWRVARERLDQVYAAATGQGSAAGMVKAPCGAAGLTD